MSETDPGGWHQASDGRWFPPDVVLPPGLTRMPGGSTVLEGVEVHHEPAVPFTRMERRRLTTNSDDDGVGGPIHPRPTIYFGRPPGTENRRAGGAALIGALLLVLASVVPWATRHPSHLQPSAVGWSDANGAIGSGWIALAIGAVALGLAAAALMGRVDTWLRVADGVAGVVAVILALVEGVRIGRASSVVHDLTDGVVDLKPTWGLILVVAGGLSLVVAAAVHRTDVPAWRRE
ncbi:MAG: hypothetical protein JJE52_07100 [Acidimicrobiia bacterium]|nr:hypothetical protein [Acidimicrobiia bacterium]